MLRNYFKIAWRSLKKNRLQTSINLLGLTVGTVCCISILVYVFAQFGYDTHHDDAQSLYRVRSNIKSIGNTSINSTWAASGPPIVFAMKEDFPEVEDACRIVYFGEGDNALLRAEGSTEGYYEPRGYVADSTFFEFFKYSFSEGNPSSALNAPNTVVLSSKLAKKLFGTEKVYGKEVIMGDGDDALNLIVKGVFNEQSGKSHLNPNYVMTMFTPGVGQFVRENQNYANQNFVYSYVKLTSGVNASELEGKLPEFLQTRGAKDLKRSGFDKTLLLQPVKDIHLFSKGIESQIDPVSDIQNLYVLLFLAGLILLVACVNFVNLSTARAKNRAKEIGVRKVVGASKNSLINQFLCESVLLSLIATLISIPIAILVSPFLNELTQGDLTFVDFLDYKILLLISAIGFLTGIIAGVYPALILSSIKPVKVLKGVVSAKSGHAMLRKSLVVFQFVVSIGLISSVIIVIQQLKYTQQKDMGFDKEQLLAIRLGTDVVSQRYGAIMTEMKSVGGVAAIAGSDYYPSQLIRGDVGLHLPSADPTIQTKVMYNSITPDYFKTTGIKLLAGRELRAQDSTQVVVNKTTIDVFNIKLDSAIGSIISQTYEGRRQDFEIVGVSDDYHFASLKSVIEPLILFNESQPNWMILRTNSNDFKSLLVNLAAKWKITNPNIPFVYTFVDKEVEKLYVEEQRLSKISILFTMLAIIISCLGLFGLVSYVAEQKRKEIGIRKVLGASVQTVVKLLTKDFVLLVGIAFVIAVPLAYFTMQNWLQDFTYRIDISLWVFFLAGFVALIITLLTVSFQAIKAAIANPVKSLRTE